MRAPGIVCGVLGLIALAGCGAEGTPTASAPAARTVSVVTVGPAEAVGAVRASVTVGYRLEPVLSFRTPGVIQGIAVDEGDRVAAGQRLAWLKPTEVAAGAAQAEASLAAAKRDFDRAKALFDRGFVSQARLDDAQTALDRAQAAYDSARFDRETAEIRAPAAGVILRRLAEPSQVAAAGAPILALGETASGMVARAAVPAAAASRIAVGDRAEVLVTDIRPAPFEGRVTRVAGRGDARTGAFDVEIALRTPSGLASGMVGEALIAAKPDHRSAGAMAVPSLALIDARADQGSVFVVDAQSIARRRAVRTGGVVGDTVFVLEGLTPGERVVSAGIAYVRDGDRVEVAGQP